MGLFKTAATAASALGSVATGVFGIVRGAGKIGSSILKSTAGKFAIGLGAAAILLSDPTDGKGGGSLLSKVSEGFKSFVGGIGKTVSSKAGGAAITAASAVTRAGAAVNSAEETLEDDRTKMLSLRDMVIDQNFEAPDRMDAPEEQEESVPAPGPEQGAGGMELC